MVLQQISNQNSYLPSYLYACHNDLSQVDMCGHLTLASAYILFGSSIVHGDEIHFHPKRGGHLQARKLNKTSSNDFLIELNLPVLPSYECDSELARLQNTFKGIRPISWRKTASNDLLVSIFLKLFLRF